MRGDCTCTFHKVDGQAVWQPSEGCPYLIGSFHVNPVVLKEVLGERAD